MHTVKLLTVRYYDGLIFVLCQLLNKSYYETCYTETEICFKWLNPILLNCDNKSIKAAKFFE